MHHPMPYHEPKMGNPLRGPAFGNTPHFLPLKKEELVSLTRYDVFSSLSPKRKNWSLSLLLPIWKEIIHLPQRVDLLPP